MGAKGVATLDESLPDVQTTNWNAVKLLATKYGIQVRTLEEVHASFLQSTRNNGEEHGSELLKEGGGEEDLGVGTPFAITARKEEGGRVVYHFRHRDGAGEALRRGESSDGGDGEDFGPEAGYEPGSDSPTSSWGKSMAKKKASTRTLKTKRSVPILQSMSALGSGTSKPAGQLNQKRSFSAADAKPARYAAPAIQRGDVLGAILGLRSDTTAKDTSWSQDRQASTAEAKKKPAKKYNRETQQEDRVRFAEGARARRAENLWRDMSPFGEPVLQRSRDVSFALQSMAWQKSPIPRMAEFGQPLFDDAEAAFKADASQSGGSAHYDDEVDTQIFDVLQREGRPQARLSARGTSSPSPGVSPTRVRQVSSSSSAHSSTVVTSSSAVLEDKAALTVTTTPGDDPRFALWAVRRHSEGDVLVLSSRDGQVDSVSSTPLTSPRSPSTPGKRFSVRMSASPSSSGERQPTAAGSGSDAAKIAKQQGVSTTSGGAFMIAAATSYLVAELTSRIDNRLMTDFFYTYRAYMSSHKLLELLILRFKWAISGSKESDDEARRKIVRVRTYVVIKYWLTNFFEVDFVPNRALRKELTDWLNTLSQKEGMPDMSIIKSLKKIVRGLKQGYEQAGVGGILHSEAGYSPEGVDREVFPGQQDGQEQKRAGELAVSLDLEGSDRSTNATKSPIEASPTTSSYPEVKWRHSNNGPPLGTTATTSAGHNAPPPLPSSNQNAISKAFVNTVGRFSRFKRNMNTRAAPGSTAGNAGAPTSSDGWESEATDCGDLLFVRGGVESFLEFFNLGNAAVADEAEKGAAPSEEEEAELTSDGATGHDATTPSLSSASNQTESTPASSIDLDCDAVDAQYGLGIDRNEEVDGDLAVEATHLTPANLAKTPNADLLHHFQSDQTLRSVSTAQQTPTEEVPREVAAITIREREDYGAVREQRRYSSPTGPNIVQIDDIDLSSDEDDGMVRRALRRLPGARDLRMANNVQELESTMGRPSMESLSANSFGQIYNAVSRQSLASHFRRSSVGSTYENMGNVEGAHVPRSVLERVADAPVQIGTVHTEMFDPDEALQGYELVKGFRLDQFDSDDEEPGDVEAALRRLEGFIDEDKQKEKQRRVEAMWLRSQKDSKEEEKQDAIDLQEKAASSRQSAPVIPLPSAEPDGASEEKREKEIGVVAKPVPMQKSVAAQRREQIKTAMPVSSTVQRSRPGVEASSSKMAKQGSSAGEATALARLWTPSAPVHRSFLLDHRSEVIAQQFSLIESELFTSVTWQELVSEQWKRREHSGQVLDWTAFYQARVRRRAEQALTSQEKPFEQDTNVEAIVARFNLTCNWIASEIVLTRQAEERAAVICKLIRIAWKCYHQCNFSTLTQIILGLQSPWVERLGRTWSRVGMLEIRMLRDLKAFINPARNFKHLRTAMRDMVVQGGMEDLITSSGPPKAGSKGKQSQQNPLQPRDGCIPFFGLFLSDLSVNDSLPTYIDPSSPSRPANVDASAGTLASLADPRAFDHLPHLPDTVKVAPLINLYKYRMIASTVKSVLALQERLASYEYQADADVYVKTLRLRCLEGEQLTQISHLVEP